MSAARGRDLVLVAGGMAAGAAGGYVVHRIRFR
jgi:hypothetical protein